MLADLLARKQTHFLLWRPGVTHPAPSLYIGAAFKSTHSTSEPQKFEDFREIPLCPNAQFPDLWEVAAQDCGLQEETVYFYWFKVQDTDAYTSVTQVLYCTDPIAWTINRRFPAPTPSDPRGIASFDPASVILYRKGNLVPCDSTGQTIDWQDDASPDRFAPNNRLVIYELPTRWVRLRTTSEMVVGSGTFQDVLALFVAEQIAPDFPTLPALNNRAHLLELGINALELLPPADSDDVLNWGYGTANFFAADFDLGRPDNQEQSTASTDLVALIKTCHQNGVRFFLDAVMAFSRNNPYHNVNFMDFYVKWGSGDPEQGDRDGFEGDLFKYNYWLGGYHPITGEQGHFVPAREYMKLAIAHWMTYYRIDGIRLDSVNNVSNYDFLQELKGFAWFLWEQRCQAMGVPVNAGRDRFLVVGEELSVPLSLLRQNRLDGLWNEKFKQIVRQVILGSSWQDEASFEWSVRKLIDCRLLGFSDGAQAVNYLTSHDVSGLGNERMFNWLVNNGVTNIETRIKLAFVCLLTAVGIPMILAGDEFADQQDLDINLPLEGDIHKQVDPVNYCRLQDDWRQRVFNYVSRLVRFRTTSNALAVNDTHFIHSDFEEGKRVMVWQRGIGEEVVIVVANFSDFGTPNPEDPAAEYFVLNWMPTPPGKQWREITQDRVVAPDRVGKEPIFPWEAKIYALEAG